MIATRLDTRCAPACSSASHTWPSWHSPSPSRQYTAESWPLSRLPLARPSAMDSPCPSAPELTSTRSRRVRSGWPCRRLSMARSVPISLAGRSPPTIRAAYQAGAAWPLDSTNTSRSEASEPAGHRIWSNLSTLMMSTQDSEEPACPDPARQIMSSRTSRHRVARAAIRSTSASPATLVPVSPGTGVSTRSRCRQQLGEVAGDRGDGRLPPQQRGWQRAAILFLELPPDHDGEYRVEALLDERTAGRQGSGVQPHLRGDYRADLRHQPRVQLIGGQLSERTRNGTTLGFTIGVARRVDHGVPQPGEQADHVAAGVGQQHLNRVVAVRVQPHLDLDDLRRLADRLDPVDVHHHAQYRVAAEGTRRDRHRRVQGRGPGSGRAGAHLGAQHSITAGQCLDGPVEAGFRHADGGQ